MKNVERTPVRLGRVDVDERSAARIGAPDVLLGDQDGARAFDEKRRSPLTACEHVRRDRGDALAVGGDERLDHPVRRRDRPVDSPSAIGDQSRDRRLEERVIAAANEAQVVRGRREAVQDAGDRPLQRRLVLDDASSWQRRQSDVGAGDDDRFGRDRRETRGDALDQRLGAEGEERLGATHARARAAGEDDRGEGFHCALDAAIALPLVAGSRTNVYPTSMALAAGVALAIAACTEQLVVRPEGEFSWEPRAELIWPVEGAVVSGYGDASRPSHRGIDLAAHPGDPVAAALVGKVSFVGEIRGYGNVVVLSHGEQLTTLYAHLGETRVARGDRVLRGQTIGTVGADGYLHYEIRESKEPVDPAKLYAVAPNPVAGGEPAVRERLAGEPPSLGTLGAADVPQPPPPPPTPRATEAPRVARVEPTRAPTPAPIRPRPTMAPARPTPSPPPTLSPPRARPTETARPTPQAPGAAAPSGESAWSGVGVGAAVVASNLLYVPAKLAYAAAGAVTGTFVLVFARDTSVAQQVWTPTLRGDYFVTAAHLRGETPLHFVGSETETPPLPPRPKPVRRRRDSSNGASRQP